MKSLSFIIGVLVITQALFWTSVTLAQVEVTVDNAPKRFVITHNDGINVQILLGEVVQGTNKYFMKYALPSGLKSKAQEVQTGKRYNLKIQELGVMKVDLYLNNPDLEESNSVISWVKEIYNGVTNLPVWSQDIFVVPDSSLNISKEQQVALANKYAPIAALDSTEDYLPASLEYIFNHEKVDSDLSQEMISLKFALYEGTSFTERSEKQRKRFADRPEMYFKYNDAVDILATNGDSVAVLNTKHVKDSSMANLRRFGNPDNVVVYYSFLPNNNKNEILLNYHFLYSFDPKLGSVDKAQIASHMYDRESITVVLDKNSLEPKYVIYGAHLDNQTMGHLSDDAKNSTNIVKKYLDDKNTLQQWGGGKVVVKWQDVIKVRTHPFVAIAKGSHAPYPAPGLFAVYLKRKIETLVEPADSSIGLLPSGIIDDSGVFAKSYGYNLKDLELNRITSTSWNRVLAFSGYMVDVLAQVNAKFPPFTSREVDSAKWANVESSYFWDKDKVSESSQNVTRKIKSLK